MRHFFLERFREPREWYTRRLAYTRSVAASSVAGHLLGLGDRHSANILLDVETAECVHIDLGIAFEQGRFLNTPERVPFRLTRDMVDGMGPRGVEGPLRLCMESCTRVLRANKGALLTVVDVFIHDPLFEWALTPQRANRRQRDDVGGGGEGEGSEVIVVEPAPGPGPGDLDADVSADAARAILRVRQKLEGLEFGDGEPRGVEGQVQQLLADAQDPGNLARMYYGWASWC